MIKNRIAKNYPWIICAGCFLLYFCAAGLVTISFSTYLPFLKADIGLTNTETSMINTVRCLVSVGAMALAGKYYRLFSLRSGTALACLLLALACMMFSITDSALMCYIGAAVMGVTYSLGTMIPIAVMIKNWFSDRGSIALAIVTCGSSVSTAVMPPVITSMINAFGIQNSFRIETVFVVIISAVLFAVLRDKPENMGLKPFADETKIEEGSAAKATASADLPRGELILLLIAMFFVGWVATPYTNHLSIHYITQGFSGVQAASALSVFGITMIAGKFMFGVASNRFGTYRVNYLFLGVCIVACFMTASLGSAHGEMLYVSSVLNGIGIPIGTIGITLWCGDLSTPDTYAKRVQTSQTLYSLGALAGAPLPGIIADATGSYAGACIMFGVILVAVTVIIQAIYHRHLHDAGGNKTSEEQG